MGSDDRPPGIDMLRRMPKTIILRTVLPLLVVALAAGCSSSKSNAGSGPGATTGASTGSTGGGAPAGSGKTTFPPHAACGFLTAQDAQTILGGPVGDPTDETKTGVPYPQCNYVISGAGFATVGLTIFTGAAVPGLIALWKPQYPGMTSLSGVGDQALADPTGAVVVAVKGSTGCVLLRAGTISGSPSASTKALAAICTKVFAATG